MSSLNLLNSWTAPLAFLTVLKVVLHKASYASTFLRTASFFYEGSPSKQLKKLFKLCDQNTSVMWVLSSKTDDTHTHKHMQS